MVSIILNWCLLWWHLQEEEDQIFPKVWLLKKRLLLSGGGFYKKEKVPAECYFSPQSREISNFFLKKRERRRAFTWENGKDEKRIHKLQIFSVAGCLSWVLVKIVSFVCVRSEVFLCVEQHLPNQLFPLSDISKDKGHCSNSTSIKHPYQVKTDPL